MVTTLATKSNTALVLGEYGEIEEFAKRIKMLMRGGDKLSNPEVMALAQFAKLTNLNPFIGECWYIPGSGPMVGIAGARRLGQEQAGDAGGFSFPTLTPVSPEEAGALESELKDVAAAFKAEITDTSAVFAYQKMFTATIQAMREAGVPDAFAAAKEVCGPRPSWVGYGYSTRGERSRMNKTQLARKRAEADALKKIIVIPFGAQVADSDVSPEYVDAPAEDVTPKRTKEQNLTELGFKADVEAVDQAFPPAPTTTEPPAPEPVKLMPRGDDLDTPEVRSELRAEFSKKFNAAIKTVNAKNLPRIDGDSSASQIREALAGIDAAVAAAA